MVSVSNKSFLGSILEKEIPSDRLYGSITAEAICVLNGVDIIRTHNVEATKDAITVSLQTFKITQRLIINIQLSEQGFVGIQRGINI